MVLKMGPLVVEGDIFHRREEGGINNLTHTKEEMRNQNGFGTGCPHQSSNLFI